MGLLSFVKDIFKPAADIVDDIHTSEEEKLILRNELAKIQSSLSEKAIELESKLIEYQSNAVVAEAKGESWLQRNWRPLSMLWFLFLVSLFWFGLTPDSIDSDLIEKVFELFKYGLTGYIVGRSVEKSVKVIKG